MRMRTCSLIVTFAVILFVASGVTAKPLPKDKDKDDDKDDKDEKKGPNSPKDNVIYDSKGLNNKKWQDASFGGVQTEHSNSYPAKLSGNNGGAGGPTALKAKFPTCAQTCWSALSLHRGSWNNAETFANNPNSHLFFRYTGNAASFAALVIELQYQGSIVLVKAPMSEITVPENPMSTDWQVSVPFSQFGNRPWDRLSFKNNRCLNTESNTEYFISDLFIGITAEGTPHPPTVMDSTSDLSAYDIESRAYIYKDGLNLEDWRDWSWGGVTTNLDAKLRGHKDKDDTDKKDKGKDKDQHQKWVRTSINEPCAADDRANSGLVLKKNSGFRVDSDTVLKFKWYGDLDGLELRLQDPTGRVMQSETIEITPDMADLGDFPLKNWGGAFKQATIPLKQAVTSGGDKWRSVELVNARPNYVSKIVYIADAYIINECLEC